jgi:hypothetical protein
MNADEIEAVRKERILSLAMGEALTWGACGALVGGAAVTALTLTNPQFKKLTQISIKVAIPTMIGLGLFSLKHEHAVHRLKREPHLAGLTDSEIVKGKITDMPIHHIAANAMYDHPFALLAGLGLPFAGYILNDQMKLTHLKVSQRVMHSRVFAQGGILCMLLATMGFRGWMDKRGRFPEN